MLNNLFYIVWDFDPVMFNIGGFELRYYGLMWAITFLLGERFDAVDIPGTVFRIRHFQFPPVFCVVIL